VLPREDADVAFDQFALYDDWYGSPVNLASRVTSAAPANTVRVTEAARKSIGDPAGIEWSVPEARRLKGIRGEVLLYGAHRPGSRREVIGPAGSA
jgi:class 3 adenylate cyclase